VVHLLQEHERRSNGVSFVSQLVGSLLADPFEAPREKHAHDEDNQKYDIHGKQRSNSRVLVHLLANSRNDRLQFLFPYLPAVSS
jgi:hypothetical protein